MPGPTGVPRADILRLLADGLSDRAIGRALHTNPKRVGRIRAELDLPQWEPTRIPLHQKWTARTRQVAGGHVRWEGAFRSGMPNLVHGGVNYSARRVAFEIGTGREPVGRVLPDCGMAWCVAPQHATDERMRRADSIYGRLFPEAA